MSETSNDDNQQNNNNDDSSQQNNDNNNTSQSKTVVIGCDHNNSEDQTYQDTVGQVLEQAGYQVEKLAIDPNAFASYSYDGSKAKGKIGIYLIAVGLTSIADLYSGGTSFDYAYFGIRGGLNGIDTMDEFKTKSVHKDKHGDCTPAICNELDGKTFPEINEITKDKCQAVFGSTPDEMAQNLLAALGGQTTGTGSTVSSGGGAQIKDKTFEKCIRRICAATDSVFLVENNAAVLFPYTDWLAFTLREKISTITPKEIDPNVFSMDYHNVGTYNKVSIAWGGATLPERFPDNPIMHKQYVKNQKAKQQEEENTQTTKKHGTTQKHTAKSDGTNILSEQYDILVDKYGELEKRIESPVDNYETAQYLVNALLIQYVRDFNTSCECRALGNRKYIGGTFYIVTNPFTYEKEMLYLNGYTVRTQKDAPIYFDLDFRYGPESAEELLDYQYYTGGAGAVSSGGAGGQMGGESQDVNQLAAQICNGITKPYDKMVAIHNYLKDHIDYDSHECSRYKSASDCLKHLNDLNCADTSRLTRAVMSAAGLDAQVVHGDYHFWTVITIDGKEYASDAVSAYHDIGDVWKPSGTSHYNDGGPYYDKCGKNPSC